MKLEINHKENTENRRTWGCKNSEWGNGEVKEEIKIYLETLKNENTTTPNLQEPTANAVPGKKLTAIQASRSKYNYK